ncbi:MAG: hypothetical protein R2832_19120 [Rhodothermales bacterium]
MTGTFHVSRETLGELGEALVVIRAACVSVGVNFFVVGAAARDLSLEHIYGVPLIRATKDVDVAAIVSGWDEFHDVTAELIGTHGFSRSGRAHRFNRGTMIIDLVPFGEIADERGQIVWPKGERVMTTLGFPEAYAAAIGLVVDDGPELRVASLPGVVILKLVAWSEAPQRRTQDPVDICVILMSYDRVVGERLFTDHVDLLDNDEFDYRIAASRICGRDAAKVVRNGILRLKVIEVLQTNTKDDLDSPLAIAMGNSCHRDFDFRLKILRAFLSGLGDGGNDNSGEI